MLGSWDASPDFLAPFKKETMKKKSRAQEFAEFIQEEFDQDPGPQSEDDSVVNAFGLEYRQASSEGQKEEVFQKYIQNATESQKEGLLAKREEIDNPMGEDDIEQDDSAYAEAEYMGDTGRFGTERRIT